MFEQYLQICHLLDQTGPLKSRLDLIQATIQKPDFKYQKESFPEILTDTLVQSSYWLDTELFDSSYLCEKNFEHLSGMQQAHLKMLDIGITLMRKGFSLKYNPEKYTDTGKSEFSPYAKTFIEQCYKRQDFLYGKTTHRKNYRRSLISQKTLS